MTPSSKARSTLVMVLSCAFVAVAGAAQAQQGTQAAASALLPTPGRVFPAPINLKVLPKDLTGRQVHDVMEEWAKSLGVRCDACHVEDTEGTAVSGTPHLDFADDSKPMKAVARRMYTMTDRINSNYIASLNGSGMPVTCGTCHRGAVSPAPFVGPARSEPHSAPAAQVATEGQQSQ